MKTLILRTFAHSNIWEGYEEYCHFELAQKAQILNLEPNYLSFNINDFDKAIGIYTNMYFNGYSCNVIANTGTDNEKIISELGLYSINNNLSFPFYDSNDRICVPIKFVKKLWIIPNKELMFKIDKKLIEAKMDELKSKDKNFIKPIYFPLSFSLDSQVVENILLNTKL